VCGRSPRLGYIFEGQLRLSAPGLVDAAIDGNPSQPERHVRERLDLRQPLVKLKKDLLSYIFGLCAISQEVAGDTENHGLVLPHQLAKGLAVTVRGLPQGGRHLDVAVAFQMSLLPAYTHRPGK
jgi:hypothetical protein